MHNLCGTKHVCMYREKIRYEARRPYYSGTVCILVVCMFVVWIYVLLLTDNVSNNFIKLLNTLHMKNINTVIKCPRKIYFVKL